MRYLMRFIVLSFHISMLVACSAGDESAVATGSADKAEPQVITIVAKGLRFDMPAEVPAGWRTFRFINKSPMTHFAVIEKMPPGIGMIDQQEQVAPVFQDGLDFLNAGNLDAGMAEFGKLPAWFADIQFMGGPGFVAGGGVAETTVFLEPGTYLLECYVKTGGIFHSFNPSPVDYGMVAEFTVVPFSEASKPPEADLTVNLSAESGIQMGAAPQAGPQVVAVKFKDQKLHENFVGHDLQLVRLEPDTDVDALVEWMDWRQKNGLETPAPAVFVGGTNEMPAGSTAYLHLNLEPGEYAWISEVPDAPGKGLFRKFEVAALK